VLAKKNTTTTILLTSHSPDLQRDEEGDRLHAVVPAVNVVAHEEVVGVGHVAACAQM
jgi:hypothetical protein